MKISFRQVLILLIVINSFALFAQEPTSFHKQEWSAHKHLSKQPSLYGLSGNDIIPLQPNKTPAPVKTIFGYLPDWEYVNAHFLQYDVLTHIAAFDFFVSANGNIGNPGYWPWTDVINKAHEKGVKIIMTAVNFEGDQIHNLLTNDAAKNNFFVNVRNKINTYHLDGVNVDFEGLYTADRGALLNGFMTELSTYIHTEIPGSEVSFAGPAVNWGGWELAGLAEACDYIFIMGYAFYGSWSSTSGPNAPLTGGTYNITNTVNIQYGEVTNNNPQKLILGLPHYGHRWQTETGLAYSAANKMEESPRFHSAQKEGLNYGIIWDVKSQTPWYRYQQGTDWYQVWFDDDSSLGLKYDLAGSKNYRGVGMWAQCYDGSRSEIWNELRSRYVPGTLPVPDQPDGISVYSAGENSIAFSIADQDYTDGYYVYYGLNGISFEDSMYFSGNSGTITNLQADSLYYFKFKAKNDRTLSSFSSLLAASCTSSEIEAVIIDGFDRNNGGNNTFDYIRYHAQAFKEAGYAVASAQNEAVINDDIDLLDFKYCGWFLGDESTADFTLNYLEQKAAENYLAGGGNLFISGCEIGWDLVEKGSPGDQNFYENYLKAEYVSDAPLNQNSTYYHIGPLIPGIFDDLNSFYFDNGSHGTYNAAWPDAVSAAGGGELCLKYVGVSSANGGCAVKYEGAFGGSSSIAKLVYMSIPLETIYPEIIRFKVVQNIINFFNSTVSINNKDDKKLSWQLEQNYPNPFNPKTAISYQLAFNSEVDLSIYNLLGQKMVTLDSGQKGPGLHSITWDASAFASGVYFYRIKTDKGFVQTKKLLLQK